MDRSAVLDGKVYVLHVKDRPDKNFDANDEIYAFAHQGSGGLSYTGFRTISEVDNKRYFFTKKANVQQDKSCTWAEVWVAANQWPMKGDPRLVLIEYPMTFYDIARLAYKKGIFSNPVGLTKLDDIDSLKASSQASVTSFEPVSNVKMMLDTAAKVAKELSDQKSSSNQIRLYVPKQHAAFKIIS